MDGNRIIYGSRETSATIGLLEPETTYTFTVQAQDFGNNLSPLSDPITVTTEPSNPHDDTPPTTPTNLSQDHWNDGEIHVRWTQSTDDFDAQRFIRYDVYVNGILSDTPRWFRLQHCVQPQPGGGGLVTVEVIAVDTAGNESAPASITINMDLP